MGATQHTLSPTPSLDAPKRGRLVRAPKNTPAPADSTYATIVEVFCFSHVSAMEFRMLGGA